MSKFLGGVLQGNETVFLTQDEINNPYADIPTMIEDKKRKREQMKPTLFDHTTVSPEVLAPYLVSLKAVIITDITVRQWISTITGDVYSSRAEAIAATVEKLKEVAE